MIGFWTRDVVTDLPRRPLYSANAVLPKTSRRCTWPDTLLLTRKEKQEARLSGAAPIRHAMPEVSPAWEELPPLDGSVETDAWVGHALAVPESRNTHIFATSMEEFLFDHLKESGES